VCLAIPGLIVALSAETPAFAVVEVSGVRRTVNIGLLVDEAIAPGDWVLIHVGFAMRRISEAEAAEQMRELAALGEAAAAVDEMRGYQFG
jgi:hydrogenase expression/formation protein HypC